MIAPGVDPSAQRDCVADLSVAQLATMVGSFKFLRHKLLITEIGGKKDPSNYWKDGLFARSYLWDASANGLVGIGGNIGFVF